MNMPFELGIDLGARRIGGNPLGQKKFLILESRRYQTQRSLSDLAGMDIEAHEDSYEKVIGKVRNFFRVEAGVDAPGATALKGEYETFQGWFLEKKIFEGHSEDDALSLSTRERLDEMKRWCDLGRPDIFVPV